MINELGKRILGEAAANTSNKTLITRIMVSLDEKPLYPGCSRITTDKSLVYTSGFYHVRFKPGGSRYAMAKLFSLLVDLYPEKKNYIRFKDWNDLLKRGEKDKRIQFLLKYTNLSEDMFRVAQENIGLIVPFVMDMNKYDLMLKQKVFEQTGEYPNYSMLVDPLLILAERERINTFFANKNKEFKI